jgi:hypothetical protein
MLVAWRSHPQREVDDSDGPPVRDRLLTLIPVESR